LWANLDRSIGVTKNASVEKNKAYAIMKLKDLIEQLIVIEQTAKDNDKHIGFADVEKVTIEFDDFTDLTIKPKKGKNHEWKTDNG